MQKFTRAYGAFKLALHANAPTLLVAGGVATMGVAAVLVAKQTAVWQEKMIPHVRKMDELEKNGKVDDQTKLSMGLDAAKDTVIVYAVPAALFVGGAVLVFHGHHKLQQRNAALAIAFTALKKSFDGYRHRVVRELGHESDQYFLNGAKEVTHQDKNGQYQTNTRDWEKSALDPYNRVFSQETSNQWQNDLGCNKDFVHGQQRFAQQILNRQGYIYLSDVYRSLGIAESDISRVVGWKIVTLPDGTRNVPVVDFGLDRMIPDDWKYSANREIFLDFNCQGLIVGGKVQKMLENA